MAESKFVYVTFIRTTPAKLWEALTQPEFMNQYWKAAWEGANWKKGDSWQLKFPDGRVADTGEVLEIDKPRRLVLKWRNEFMPELKAEGDARLTMEIEPLGDVTKLTVIHEMDKDKSKTIAAVSGGWPRILSSLKSLLETGTVLTIPSPQAKAS